MGDSEIALRCGINDRTLSGKLVMMIATVIATEGAGDDAVSGERHSGEEEADGLEHVRDGVVKVGRDQTRPESLGVEGEGTPVCEERC